MVVAPFVPASGTTGLSDAVTIFSKLIARSFDESRCLASLLFYFLDCSLASAYFCAINDKVVGTKRGLLRSSYPIAGACYLSLLVLMMLWNIFLAGSCLIRLTAGELAN